MTSLMDAVAEAAVAVQRLYPVNEVPRPKPAYPYGIYSASLGREDVVTIDGTGMRSVRVVAQFFGKTVDSVTTKTTEVFLAALLNQILVIDGWTLTPLHMELDPTPPTRDPDDNGVLGVTTTLTAVATKETP